MRVYATFPLDGSVQLAGDLHHQCRRNGGHVHAAGSVPRRNAITVYSNYDGTTTDLAGKRAAEPQLDVYDRRRRGHHAADRRHGDAARRRDRHRPGRVVTLTFSEPLHPSTVNDDTFTLFSGATEISPATRGRPTTRRCS